MLTDSHCHLASGNFSSDLDDVIERAVTAKVSRMVTISTDLEDASKCIEIAKNNDSVSATVGIHPCSVTEIKNDKRVCNSVNGTFPNHFTGFSCAEY